jgi:outer membrane protein assembly factor BamB
MLNAWKKTLLVFSVGCLAVAKGQGGGGGKQGGGGGQQGGLEYLDDPVLLWTNFTSNNLFGLGEGNGIFMSPDGKMLVSTSVDATVRAFDPLTGTIIWTYKPDSVGFPIRCFGGLTFNYQAANPYMVYAIADAASDRDNSPTADT